MDMERYSRQTILEEIGLEGQKQLSDSRVLIVGVGGLGSAVATYLAGAGVGTLVLADPDTVSLSNLQRQIMYSECEIGLAKTTCAARRLRELNSDITVELHPEGLTENNAIDIISNCDIVVDCTDNYPARYLIDRVCAVAGKPWVYGSIGEYSGQISVFNHRLGRRYTDLYPEEDMLCSLPRKISGVLGSVPGVIGSMQVCEALKLLIGFGESLEGKLFTIDMLTFQTMTIRI